MCRHETAPVNTARLRVVLRDVEPTVARVIDVPASSSLPELHELLQAALGWTNSHLHQFVTPQATYGMVIPGEEMWPEDQRDETGWRLADLGTRFEYLYDFGDGWTTTSRSWGGAAVQGRAASTAMAPVRLKIAAGPVGTPNCSTSLPIRHIPSTIVCVAGSVIGCGPSTLPQRASGCSGSLARFPRVCGCYSICSPTGG